ncbi:MAG: antitoxin [Micrococcales bacterium]|nr:antitoxin [Micrococcales bacterium]
MSTETTVFRSNRTQAVRLPKAIAFPESVTRVRITTVGTSRLVTPVVPTWDEWFARTQGVTDDFMSEGRYQGPDAERVHL